MNRSTFLTSAAALVILSGARAARALPQTPAIALGDDVFLRESWRTVGSRAVGIITNQSGVTSRGEVFVDAALAQGKVRVKALFAPEHGLRGDRPAGEPVASYVDARTGLPVYSLYGATRHPSAAMLDGIDVLLFDIQDVGSRAYTYISTMAYAMQSAKAFGKEFWVLDRPNPVGGDAVEGPVLEPAYESFIGLYPIAMRHGMTVGELARLFNERFGIGAKLKVVSMDGWRRSMIWTETGLPWVRTSPNVPTWETAFALLCTGLIDNAGINNGVGTPAPFFFAGMRGLDGKNLATHLNARNLPGVRFSAASWTPIAGFWKGKQLDGVHLDVVDPRAFVPVRSAVEILVAVRTLYPHVLDIKTAALDRDWGTASLRRGLAGGLSADEIVDGWSSSVTAFRALRAKYAIYRD
jgi:uncharacterized protein YbbC (DUF1343 family)